MKDGFVRYSCLLALALIVAPALPLFAAGDARVDGKATADGKPLKFTHVYAVASGDGDEKSTKVLFSDVAISDKDLAVFPDFKAVNEGKLHGMRVVLDSHGAVQSTEIFDVSGWTTMEDGNRIKLTTFNGDAVAGRLYREKPYKDMNDSAYDFDLTFSAAVRQASDLTP